MLGIMFNLNKYFYYDSKEIYGHLKIEKNTLRLSQKLSGQYLKEILKTSLEDKWGLVCSGNFMLSLVDETEGCKLLTLESSNNIISFDKKILEEIIKTKSEYIFEIFSNSKDIAILVEDEINRNINNTTVECIQNFAFPTAHFTRESNDLFYKGTLNYFPLEGKSVKWFIGGKKQPIADFNTYFNSFNYEKWKENTDIKKVFVSFELKGEVILRLKEICEYGVITIRVVKVSSSVSKKILIEVPNNREYKLIGAEFNSSSNAEITNLAWFGEFESSNRNSEKLVNKLAIVITAYNEPQALINAEFLAREINNYCNNINFQILLVDNSKSLSESKNKLVKVIKNKNLGGTGGFIRGLIEAEKRNFTYCLFMDDDAFCSPFSIEKAFNFLQKANDKNLAISGAMLDKKNMLNQLESGAYFDCGCHPLNCNLNAGDPRTFFLNNEKHPNKIYGSWWFFMFRTEKTLNMPYPYFVRGDDIDFSYKNNFKVITLNGCCAWQDNFLVKETSVSVFLFIRSHILHYFTLNLSTKEKAIECSMTIIRNHIFKYLKQYRYDLANAVIMAVEFVLKGNKHWEDNILMGDVLKNIKLKCDKYKTTKEVNSLTRTYDFYKSLKLWPITRLTKKITLNSILIPNIFKSQKLWEIPKGNYVDYRYLFLKSKYCQKNDNGYTLYKSNLTKTLIILVNFMNVEYKLKHCDLKKMFEESYVSWQARDKWVTLFE